MTHLERYHLRAVRAFRASEGSRWVVGHASAQIVGKYARGQTLALAQDLAVSVDTVEFYAGAYLMYEWLRREFRNGAEMRRLRRSLTMTHFGRLFQLFVRLEFDPQDALDALRTAATEGASVASMVSSIEGEHGGDDGPEWRRVGRKLVRGLRLMVQAYDAPEGVRVAAGALLEVIEEEK